MLISIAHMFLVPLKWTKRIDINTIQVRIEEEQR